MPQKVRGRCITAKVEVQSQISMSVCDLWLDKQQWDRLYSEFLDKPPSV